MKVHVGTLPRLSVERSSKVFTCNISSDLIAIVITQERAMVPLKIRKFGNSLGVVLPKEVIQRLRTGDGEQVFLIEAGDGDYRLTPLRSRVREENEEGRRDHGALPKYAARFGKVTLWLRNAKNRPGSKRAMCSPCTTAFWRCRAALQDCATEAFWSPLWRDRASTTPTPTPRTS